MDTFPAPTPRPALSAVAGCRTVVAEYTGKLTEFTSMICISKLTLAAVWEQAFIDLYEKGYPVEAKRQWFN